MKLARYWIPLILGFAIGSLLSLKMSETPMRDLLSSAKAEASSGSPTETDGKSTAASAPLAENERFIRFFSAVQETRALKRRSDLHSAIGDLGPQDMEPLISRIESLRWKMNTNGLIDAILERWLEIDRAAAANWIRKHPEGRSYQVLWAKTDPQAALNELKQNPGSRWEEEIIRTAVDTLTGDPDEKAKLILQLPDGLAREQVLLKMTQEIAKREPTDALKFAQNFPDAVMRSSAIANVLQGWVRGDVEGAAKRISERLSELENTAQFGSLLSKTIGGLAHKDVNRALEWIGTLPENQRSDAAYASAASAWAEKEPIQALQWCAANGIDASISFPSSESGAVVARAMYSNPKETLLWIQSQPPGEMRDALLERALKTRLRDRGDLIGAHGDAVFQALQSLSQESQIRAATEIAKSGIEGNADQTQTFSWLEKFQDPTLRAATITGMAEASLSRGVKGPANDYSTQFAQGPERDAALRGMVKFHKDRWTHLQAANTALKISDPSLQISTLDTFMVNWLRRDTKAATEWLKTTTSIPPTQSAAWKSEASSPY